MKMTFRWYGESDPISLEYIRQIPGMKGIVSAIYDIPVGEIWPLEKIQALKSSIEAKGLELSVIESVPVHEDIKTGKPTRDKYIENYKTTLKNLGEAGIPVVCYNFMPVFDWTRSDLAYPLPDGSNALIFDEEQVNKMDPRTLSLPGWDESYTAEEMNNLMDEYKSIDNEKLWENLEYFIKGIMPTAEAAGVKMAIHPDDPPYSIFGLPRIITGQAALDRFIKLYDSEYNGVTLCVGSFASDPKNDAVAILESMLEKNRVNFVHARNVKLIGGKSFQESAHLSEMGSIDMYRVVKALSDHDFKGAIRPDHGRMIWGETGKPGYGLFDRALGATYLNGLYEAAQKAKADAK
ncbi:mannonate dehydratase [Carnobacterium sp. 17-4]|uniref:mannonate dehydratase n=1 Tax=Carnobacterium sp. (strain 17-4) TaxID=208596 RepID=UPI0002058D17|nr:mannonate dehydratase [Carnobacterium sp. 17-4]AEB30744.1 mannonate dehydratase [Carnobacterium sp. 17-4]